MGTGKVVKVECIQDMPMVCSIVWGGVGGVGDRSAGCLGTFSDPSCEGFQ